MENNIYHTVLILIAITVRILAAWGAYWTVIRRMLLERADIPADLRGYNLKLIISVFTFIVTCIGTSFFQACRVGWFPGCQSSLILDEIALFNSFGLLAAYFVMHLLVNATDKQKRVAESEAIVEIKKDVKKTKHTVAVSAKDIKEVKVDVKIIKKKKDEFDKIDKK